MNREQAIALLNAISSAQGFVPPLIFAQIAGQPAMRTIEAVANGLMELSAAQPADMTADAEENKGE